MIDVMVVDDDRYARKGIILMLKKALDIRVTAQAADGREAVRVLERMKKAGRSHPNVVLMDVRMPAMDGIDATREITRRWPGMRVLILTTYDQDDYALGGLLAGASGFLLKDVRAFQLAQAVRDVFAGDAVLTPRVTREVVERAVPGTSVASRRERFSSLSPRELEVASLVAEGLSNAEIAERLTIEVASVRRTVSRVLAKLGMRDRVQVAVAWWRG